MINPYLGKSNVELVALQAKLCSDPANQLKGGLKLYTPNTQRKLDLIARAITQNLADKRKAEGRPVPCCGYSGRRTNRRR